MVIITALETGNEDDYEYECSALSTRFGFGGRRFSKCACSELNIKLVLVVVQSYSNLKAAKTTLELSS